MSLSNDQKINVKNILRKSLLSKFETYIPESVSMPFHIRLLGKDRMTLFSFIHSLNTNFGITIFEPIATELAKPNFKIIRKQVNVGTKISDYAQREIQNIMNNLSAKLVKPDKMKEIDVIREVSLKGEMHEIKLPKADIFLEKISGERYLFDIKAAKPNKGGFKEFKRTLLEWAAVTFVENPNIKVNTLIAIPYNPYDPKPYARWTMSNTLDRKHELKVAEEFWNFLAGKVIYDDLLNCFSEVGTELKHEVNNYFKRYN